VEKLPDIIKNCIKGKSQSQERLYRLFSQKMFGVCLQYCNNYDEAKDILQEGFIKVFENLKQFNNKGSFEGWVRRIMINTVMESYRNQFHLYPVIDFDEKIAENYFDDFFDELSARDLIRFIQELTPKYRLVFNLYAIEGYSHKEISKMLGISLGTSKSNLSRARTILQEKVKKYYTVVSEII